MKTVFLLLACFCCFKVSATIWLVGPTRTYTKPSQVSTFVQNGDTVNIDAGTYTLDVAFWSANNLVLRGVGGLASLDAQKTSYGRKGIWVINGDNATVENVEFMNCIDPTHLDDNWAGIRLEGIHLTVRNCYFHNNDNGILAGNHNTSDITIMFSEFNHNGHGDGLSHNLYIGTARTLTFAYNLSRLTAVGHELKSRATTNYILYNRIGNESKGTASREIDLPNGGVSIIIGNQIQQGTKSQNPDIIGYGLEGLSNPSPHEVYLINNTVVNLKSSGTFLSIRNGTGKYKGYNNILAGPGQILSGSAAVVDTSKNMIVSVTNAKFVNEATYDYHLLSTSPAINNGVAPGATTGGFNLTPIDEYVHPENRKTRAVVGALDIGAYEFGTALAALAKGVPEDRLSNIKFYVYADPYDNTVNVFLNNVQQDKDVYIYNLNGSLMASQKNVQSNKVTFSKTLFTPGVYVVRTKVGQTLSSKKFIVR